MSPILRHFELEVYRLAYGAALLIFDLSEAFPVEEGSTLTDRMRRSSRSVYSGIAEAWRNRIYEVAFVKELSKAEANAAETQSWLRIAAEREFLQPQRAEALIGTYAAVKDELARMIANPDPWLLPRPE